jgi:hypothetical protein
MLFVVRRWRMLVGFARDRPRVGGGFLRVGQQACADYVGPF